MTFVVLNKVGITNPYATGPIFLSSKEKTFNDLRILKHRGHSEVG